MNVLFVLYRDFLSNSSNPLAVYTRELHLAGHSCAVAVPNNLESVSQHDDVKFRPVLYEEVLKTPQSIFPDGRSADVVHAITPREVVRKFVTSYMRKVPTPLVIYLEDNEEWISLQALDLPEETLFGYTDREIGEKLPGFLSHPFRYKNFIGLADAAAVVQDKLRIFVPPWIPCTTVMIGVDLELFSPREPDPQLRARYGVAEGEKVLVYPGSINQVNRPAIQSLCSAVGLIRERGYRCRLLRTGMYPLDFLAELPPETARSISDLGVLPKSAIPDLLALADVLVQPGTPDPFEDLRLPGKVPEFLAMGRPVVLPNTNVAGLFRDGVDVILLHTGSPDEIASRCIELFSDAGRAAAIGRAGRHMAEKLFDVRVQARLLEGIYESARKSFDPVVARQVWRESDTEEPIAMSLARKLSLMAEKGVGGNTLLIREYARFIESGQRRITALEAALTKQKAEVRRLEQELAESRSSESRWKPALRRVKSALNRMRPGIVL